MNQRFFLNILAVLTVTASSFGYAYQIDTKGIWHDLDSEKWHVYDKSLSETVAKFFKNEGANSIVDLGCGMGDYTKHLQEAGFECDGFDGNPDTPELTNGICEVRDLTEAFDLGKRYDWVLCLEVGEHIPAKYQDIFIKNIVDHAENGVVLSWAVAGQPGPGHVNTMDNVDVIKIFANLDSPLIFDSKATKQLRQGAGVHWFKNTLMVFRRGETTTLGEE